MKCLSAFIAALPSKKAMSILLAVWVAIALVGAAAETNSLKMKVRGQLPASVSVTSSETRETVQYVPGFALSATATNKEPELPPHPESPALAREQLLQQRIDMLEARLTAFAAPREPTVSPAEHEELRGEVRNLRSTLSQLVPVSPGALPTPHRLGLVQGKSQIIYWQCPHCSANVELEIRHP